MIHMHSTVSQELLDALSSHMKGHVFVVSFQCSTGHVVSWIHVIFLSEPGIRRGNKDSRGNENLGKISFSWTSILFFLWKWRWWICEFIQTECTKLIFVMNFSVLCFFKFASRMPQIAQILVSTFKVVWWGGGGGHAPRPITILEIFSFFFISNSRLCPLERISWLTSKQLLVPGIYVCSCFHASIFWVCLYWESQVSEWKVASSFSCGFFP